MNNSAGHSKKRYHHGDLEQTLVVTALALIAREGLDALTLRRIGEEVGVSRAALYRHFENKQALLARIAADGFRLLGDVLERIRASAGNVGETLEVMAAAHVHFARANPSHYMVMFGGVIKEWRTHDELAREADAALSQLVDAVRSLRPEYRNEDSLTIAQAMWTLTVGVSHLGTSGRLAPSRSLEELAVLGIRWVSDGCQTPIR